MEVKGSLGGSRLLELLQSFSVLHRDGWLTVRDSRGPQAEIGFCQGRLCVARQGHLGEEEALLASFFWNDGEFLFQALPPGQIDPQQDGALPEGFNLSSFSLNAMYWADELEKRRLLVPADGDHIVLETTFEGEDPFDCGLASVYEAIRTTGPVTVAELQERLPLAPLKIRLALAYLAEKGVVRRPQVGLESASSGKVKTWWVRLAARFGGGFRVLVIVADGSVLEQTCQALARALRKKLKAGDPWISCSLSGPSFVRFKPEPQGVLTVCVMTAHQLQSLAECLAYASSYDVIVLTGDTPACEEEAHRAIGIPIVRVASAEALGAHFFETFASLAGNAS